MAEQINTGVFHIKKENDVEYLTFPSFDESGLVRHLFSTRFGGVSSGIYSSMNLSYTRGDCKENVDKNFEIIADVLNCNISDFVLSDQTHLDRIRVVTREDLGKGITRERDYCDIDGMITKEPGIVLATFFADCVPLYFLDPVKKVIGLTHSGWRGSVKKIGANTIKAMEENFGSRPENILAGIGPSICGNCYEVGREVAQEFQNIFSKEELQSILTPQEDDKYHLNLWQANKYILLESGLKEEHISTTDLCTCCHPDYLFSHRASHGKRGNLGAFLGLLP